MTYPANTPATSPTSSPVYASAEAIKAASATLQPGLRLITITQRNPSRRAACAVPAHAWDDVTNSLGAASPYVPLLHAVLDTAAKVILTRRIGDMQIFPASIQTDIFSADAILSEAASGNTEWLSKEELTQAWESSATRAKFINDPRYTSNKHYRVAVDKFKELIVKLAGKTSAYKLSELDSMIVKLSPADHNTDFGAFVLRRVQALQNKPERKEIDLDCLE
jgi:hypothetical protein